MELKHWDAIGLYCSVALAGELFFGFGLWFAPGWAREWPFGLPFQVVWATGLAIMLCLIVVTGSAAIGAIMISRWIRHGIEPRLVETTYRTRLIVSAILGLALGIWAFTILSR
jgi:hypothetical protein